MNVEIGGLGAVQVHLNLDCSRLGAGVADEDYVLPAFEVEIKVGGGGWHHIPVVAWDSFLATEVVEEFLLAPNSHYHAVVCVIVGYRVEVALQLCSFCAIRNIKTS